MMMKHGLPLVALLLAASPFLAVAAPPGSSADSARPDDDTTIQARAEALDARVTTALAARRLPKTKADRLHLAIGKVQTGAGHEARVNGKLTPAERKDFIRQLDMVERQLPTA